MTTGRAIALTRQTFVGKVMSLLFNMLSRLVIVFLPRSKCLLISWLQSPSAVILEPKKIKSVTISIVSPSIRAQHCRTESGFKVRMRMVSVSLVNPFVHIYNPLNKSLKVQARCS